MSPKSPIVEYLKRIDLHVEAGGTPDNMDILIEPSEFAFIFGIGTNGLSPFEYQLADKSEGETITLEISKPESHLVFQHIGVPIPKLPDQETSYFLKFRIDKITTAEQRDVIRALAEISECGTHCCGNH